MTLRTKITGMYYPNYNIQRRFLYVFWYTINKGLTKEQATRIVNKNNNK